MAQQQRNGRPPLPPSSNPSLGMMQSQRGSLHHSVPVNALKQGIMPTIGTGTGSIESLKKMTDTFQIDQNNKEMKFKEQTMLLETAEKLRSQLEHQLKVEHQRVKEMEAKQREDQKQFETTKQRLDFLFLQSTAMDNTMKQAQGNLELTQAAKDDLSRKWQDQEEEIKLINETIGKMEVALGQQKKDYEAAQRELSEARASRDSTLKTYDEERASLLNLKLIHNEKMQEHSTLEGELAALREQKSLLDVKLKAADEEVKGLGAKRSEDQSRFSLELEGMTAKLFQALSESKRLEKAVEESEARVEAGLLKEKELLTSNEALEQNSNARILELSEMVHARDEEIKKSEEKEIDSNKRIDALIEEQRVAQAEIETVKARCSQALEALETARGEKTEVDRVLSELESESKAKAEAHVADLALLQSRLTDSGKTQDSFSRELKAQSEGFTQHITKLGGMLAASKAASTADKKEIEELKLNAKNLALDLERTQQEISVAKQRAQEIEASSALTAGRAKEGWEENEGRMKAQLATLKEKIDLLQASIVKERGEKAEEDARIKARHEGEIERERQQQKALEENLCEQVAKAGSKIIETVRIAEHEKESIRMELEKAMEEMKAAMTIERREHGDKIEAASKETIELRHALRSLEEERVREGARFKDAVDETENKLKEMETKLQASLMAQMTITKAGNDGLLSPGSGHPDNHGNAARHGSNPPLSLEPKGLAGALQEEEDKEGRLPYTQAPRQVPFMVSEKGPLSSVLVAPKYRDEWAMGKKRTRVEPLDDADDQMVPEGILAARGGEIKTSKRRTVTLNLDLAPPPKSLPPPFLTASKQPAKPARSNDSLPVSKTISKDKPKPKPAKRNGMLSAPLPEHSNFNLLGDDDNEDFLPRHLSQMPSQAPKALPVAARPLPPPKPTTVQGGSSRLGALSLVSSKSSQQLEPAQHGGMPPPSHIPSAPAHMNRKAAPPPMPKPTAKGKRAAKGVQGLKMTVVNAPEQALDGGNDNSDSGGLDSLFDF